MLLDGFTSLLVKSEGGQAEELVDEEHGILISAMLRQYFMGLQTVGQWKKLSHHWVGVAKNAVPLASVRKREHSKIDENPGVLGSLTFKSKQAETGGTTWHGFLHQRLGLGQKPLDDDEDDHFDHLHTDESAANSDTEDRMDCEILLLRKFWTRWARKAGVKACVCDPIKEGEFDVDWTRVIAPRLEGRIKILKS